MEYLQYFLLNLSLAMSSLQVLNLVINGIPSIPNKAKLDTILKESFKPCYKWNTFNTNT